MLEGGSGRSHDYRGQVRVHEMIVDERRRMADLLATLNPPQLRSPTLCEGWSVHDVAAHLVSYLRFGRLKLYYGIVTTAGDFDEINRRLTRRLAAHPSAILIDWLRRYATSRITIPRSGYDPVLADIVLHDLDIRTPLRIDRPTVEERLRITFDHLARRPSPGFGVGNRLAGLRLVTTDTGWTFGTGLPARGPAEALVLAMGGRGAGLSALDGDGVPLLRERLRHSARMGPADRMAAVVRVLLDPPPRERRSRDATALDPLT
jgi:uncharacterized protein (TIGR03083 family)